MAAIINRLSSARALLNWLKTVDGSGSGLDADTVDGLHASSFREKLSANRTYYVRTDGSDSNTGLVNNSGGAFLTIAKAISVAYGLDFGIYNVTISVQSGTYTASVAFSGRHVGSGTLVLAGTSATISTTSASCITASNGAEVTISGLTLQTTTSGACLVASTSARVILSTGMTFGACAGVHMQASILGYIGVGSAYTISGGAAAHYVPAAAGMIAVEGRTVTLTGTPAFGAYFAGASSNALLYAPNCTFSGSATGPRYIANTGGGIFTNGGGASYFPGNSAGAATSPGWYS